MKTAKATEVKSRFGEFLDISRTEPVTVTKTSRPVAVLLSIEEFERLSSLEDAYWSMKAIEAHQEGYVGSDKAMKLVERKTNEEA